MWCNFCNNEMPHNHIVPCKFCGNNSHIQGGQASCECCGRSSQVATEAIIEPIVIPASKYGMRPEKQVDPVTE